MPVARTGSLGQALAMRIRTGQATEIAAIAGCGILVTKKVIVSGLCRSHGC